MSGVSIKIPVDKLPEPPLQPTRPAWSKPVVEYPKDATIIEVPYRWAPEREKKPKAKQKKQGKPKPITIKPKKRKAFRRIEEHTRSEWTEEETQTLIRMFYEGAKYKEIADEVSHGESSIATKIKNLKRKGMITESRQTKWTAEQDEIMISMHEKNISFAEIGKAIGKSGSACYSRFLKLEEKKCEEQQE